MNDLIDTSDGIMNARLHERGVSVWALAGYWNMLVEQERARLLAELANAYGLSGEQAAAAIAFYEQYRCYIDAKLDENNAPGDGGEWVRVETET